MSPPAAVRTAKMGASGARPLATMRRSPATNRRRRRDAGAAAQPPALPARPQVVAPDEVGAVRYQGGAGRAVVGGRRAPRRQLVARRAPHRIPGVDVGRQEEGAALCVALDDHEVVDDDRRARRSPFQLRHVIGTGVEPAEVLRPDPSPVHVERVQPLGAEERHHVAPVGRRRRARIGVLDVPRVPRPSLGRGRLPLDPSRAGVERVDHPALSGAIARGRAGAVEAGAEAGVRIAADRGGDEHASAPDDGARVGEPGDGGLPADVGAVHAAPALGERLSVGDAARAESAERGPRAVAVGRPGAGRTGAQAVQDQHEEGCAEAPCGVHGRAAQTTPTGGCAGVGL